MQITVEHPLGQDILDILRPWEAEGKVALAAAVSIVWTTIASYKIQTTEKGFLTSFGYDVSDPVYDWSGSLVFRLTIADAPVQDFSMFQLQKGSTTVPHDIVKTLKPGDIVAFQARRAIASAVPTSVAAALVGVAWPERYCIPFNVDPKTSKLFKPA